MEMIKTGVINGKGGVAKSTTALNLGAIAAKLGKRVLLIDLDPQGSCTQNLGMEEFAAEKGIDLEEHSAYKLFSGEAASQLALATPFENLWIVPAGINLMKLEQQIPTTPNGDSLLNRVIKNDKALDFDLVLFDSPGFIGHITNSIVNATADLIIPNLASMASIRGLEEVFSMIESVNEFRALYNLPRVNVRGHFFGRAKPETVIYQEVENEVFGFLEALGYPNTHKRHCYIADSTRIAQSESAQMPFVFFDPDHKISDQFKTLYLELYGEK